MTALRLASYAGVAAIALAVGSFPSTSATAQPPTKTGQPPRESTGGASESCRSAQLRLANMRSQIAKLQEKIDNEQAAMNAAKGESRVEAIAKLVNDLADNQKKIEEKILFAEALVSGHIGQHVREAKNFEDLQSDLQHCGLVTQLENIAGGESGKK